MPSRNTNSLVFFFCTFSWKNNNFGQITFHQKNSIKIDFLVYLFNINPQNWPINKEILASKTAK